MQNHPGVITQPPPAAGSRRVLVVDDNHDLRLTICESVHKLGYDVLDAANPEAALKLLDDPQGCPVDVMLTDVSMPNLSGSALADIAQQRWPTLKVLLMSGGAPAGAAKLYPFICKPFRRTELARAMLALLAVEDSQAS